MTAPPPTTPTKKNYFNFITPIGRNQEIIRVINKKKTLISTQTIFISINNNKIQIHHLALLTLTNKPLQIVSLPIKIKIDMRDLIKVSKAVVNWTAIKEQNLRY